MSIIFRSTASRGFGIQYSLSIYALANQRSTIISLKIFLVLLMDLMIHSFTVKSIIIFVLDRMIRVNFMTEAIGNFTTNSNIT